MSSRLLKMLGLSAEGKESIDETTSRIRSVAEFFIDLVEATEKVNFVDALTRAMPWWVQAVGESVAEAAPTIKFLATLAGKLGEIKDPDHLAYLAFTTAYQRSVEKALLTVGPPKSQNGKKKWKPSTDVQTPGEGMSFETYSIDDPFNHPFLEQATAVLSESMQALGYDDTEIRIIQNEVSFRFPGCLKGIVSHPSTREKYAALADFLDRGDGGARVRAAWLDHFEYQRYLFEEQPVFGEEPFSLSDIYVMTECGSVTVEELRQNAEETQGDVLTGSCKSSSGDKPKDPFHEDFGGRQDLLHCVMDLIGDKSFHDAIVVQGPAGSGKSAFTIRLAVELLRRGLRPIRIRFRDIPLESQNIDDVLPAAVRFWDVEQRSGGQPAAKPNELFLEGNLFEQNVKFGNVPDLCPNVLILDGWDEVSTAAEKSFERRIESLLSQIRDRFLRSTHGPRVRVVLTGRPSAAVSETSFFKKETRLLTIRPVQPASLRAFIETLAMRLADPLAPERASPTRFESVLSQYDEDFQRMKSGRGERENHGTMEVLGLPLLAHLAVRLMVQLPDSALHELVENPTSLYRELTNLTCAGGGRYGTDIYKPEIQQADLRNLLHETAAAMTVFGRDSIPYDELDDRLSEMDQDLLDRVQHATKDNPVTSLMINFFFKGGRRELGAEFVHKSFREYLFAEAVVKSLKDYGRTAPDNLPECRHDLDGLDFQPSDSRYHLSRRLGALLAPQWISVEVSRFIEGLLRWELSRSHNETSTDEHVTVSSTLRLSEWRRVADGLADLWNWWGEGVHLRLQPQRTGKQITGWDSPYVGELVEWSMPVSRRRGEVPIVPRSTSMDGHLGDGILFLAAVVHHFLAATPRERDQWAYPDESGEADEPVRRHQIAAWRGEKQVVRFWPSGPNAAYMQNRIARINAVGWHPRGQCPSARFMRDVVLRSCDLSLINAEFCRLTGADLRRANLGGAHLIGANLYGANLCEANLREAHLLRANLGRANLSKTDLGEANLYAANLNKADLSAANMYRANLGDAVLAQANLSAANLSGANLCRAYLGRANLSDARLCRADLSEADLRKADLRNALLGEADLRGARFLDTDSLDGLSEEQRNMIRIEKTV